MSASWTIEEAVNLWLAFVAEGKASTARAYRTDFEKRFLPFCKSEGLVYLEDLLRPGVASRFAAYLDQQRNGGLPLSANTRQRSKASVKSFARWCVTEGLLPRDFARVLTLPKRHRVAQRPPTILTPQQYDLLEAAIDLKSPWGLRDRAILALTYATGCRSHEARWMRRYHVREYRQDVMLLDLKTGKWKAVPVEGWVLERLLAWIEAANLGPEDYLWPSRQAPVLSRKGWWDIIHRIGSRAGMPYLRPHDFGHTLREDAHEAGVSLESVAALTGTSVVTLAEHYGRRQRPADAHEAAQLIHEFRRWRRLREEPAALWQRAAGEFGA